MRLMKYKSGKTVSWGIVEGAVLRPVKSRDTVAEIFAACRKKSVKTAGRLPLDSVTPLAPTDAGARVFCAGLTRQNRLVRAAAAASAASSSLAICEPVRKVSASSPIERARCRTTSSLSPDTTFTLTPVAASLVSASAAVAFGGSRKAA
mgnify:CR=1 FL=1